MTHERHVCVVKSQILYNKQKEVCFITFNDDAAEETCDMIFDCFCSLGVSSSEVDFFCAFDDSIVFLFKKTFKKQKQED